MFRKMLGFLLAASFSALLLIIGGTAATASPAHPATPTESANGESDRQITQVTINLSCSPKGGSAWNAEVMLHAANKKMKVYYKATIKDEDGTEKISGNNGYSNTSKWANSTTNTAYGTLEGEGSVDLEVTVGNIPGNASVRCPAVS